MLKKYSSEDVVRLYNPTGVYPFNAVQTIRNMGITVIPYDLDMLGKKHFKSQIKKYGKIVGAVIATSEKIAIFYNRNISAKSRRFTLACELAHCCLDMDLDAESRIIDHIEILSISRRILVTLVVS